MPTGTSQRFRLTASAIAAYTKHRCDRLFRWQTVPAQLRGQGGIGWNVPKRERAASRPAIRLLMAGGDAFELSQVRDLITDVGEDRFLTAGEVTERGRTQVAELSLETFLNALRQPQLPAFIAQIAIDLTGDPLSEQTFLGRFGLDAALVQLGPARPDLIQVIESSQVGAPATLRIWDFKASRAARHEHFIQVAYYSLLLEHVLEGANIPHVRVDTETAVIRSRKGDERFALEPYRRALTDFLQHQVMVLFGTPAIDAHYHVCDSCVTCEYADHCRAEANAGSDLSRIAYISSESKRRLNAVGMKNHRALARLANEPNAALHLGTLRELSHDLTLNAARYLAAAQSLEDGQVRELEQSTLLMPRYEQVRVVLSAEQDGVTGTCFALGIKVYEGYDAENKQVVGGEYVFVADHADDELSILVPFLRTLNQLMLRVDATNRAIAGTPIDTHPDYQAAQQTVETAKQALQDFQARYPRLVKSSPLYQELHATRDQLKQAGKEAERALKAVQRRLKWELQDRPQLRLHFYLYDTLDLLIIRQLLERHAFVGASPELLAELVTLVRLFPPESLLSDADTYRTIPGTVVINVLRLLVALPIPYGYSLQNVSQAFRPSNAEGEEGGSVYLPRYGFGWDYSNQVAFERIHDVWNGNTIDTPGKRGQKMTPDAILAEIELTVRKKLRATDSIIRRLKQSYGERLLLRKEAFRLHDSFDPLQARDLEILRVFTVLEASLNELQVKHTHTLPLADRAAKFECVNGLRYIAGADEPDGSLWFTCPPEARDAKFEPGDFTLVLTPEDNPATLLGTIDGTLFQPSRRHDPYKVTIVTADFSAEAPRVCLLPSDKAKFGEAFGSLNGSYVLDRLYIDFNSAKVIDVLLQLHTAPEQARHVVDIVQTGRVSEWQPLLSPAQIAALEADLYQRAQQAGVARAHVLNGSQLDAWRGVMAEPLTLVWGPPGTGKTYTLAHMLIGYVLAAQRLGRPLRLLVTAFTHSAITNVLKKLAELADRYGLGADDLAIVKVGATGLHSADAALPDRISSIQDQAVRSQIESAAPCVIVGSTVWGIYRALKKSYGSAVQGLFDVVLVDEASQMKLPDALLAFASSKTSANLILAGDDEQLPPIIHGEYPEQYQTMLSSVFAFVRRQMEQREAAGELGVRERMLFQLEENFRMNEPLTAYPRDVLYQGRYRATRPDIRMRIDPPIDTGHADLWSVLLSPDRPVVLVRYTAPRSFTARNPLEAELIVQLTERLAATLIDQESGQLYQPVVFAQHGLGILSPHRAQNSAIRQALRGIGFATDQRPMPVVDTVDKLQGQERDVIFVSYGVADAEYAEGEADFLLSKNRFNVAATRARHKLIVLCSDAVLDVVPTDHQVLVDSMMLKEFRRYCDSGQQKFEWTSQAIGPIALSVQWKSFPV